MIGQKFKKLTVIERLPGSKLKCLCDCGKERIIHTGHFNAGYYGSCGCDHWHGHAGGKNKKKSEEYISYFNMIARCHKEKNKRFCDYGAKGILVCERWRESFINFIGDMGACPPGYTIDRIDNNKGYSPENCRWASREQNQRNRKCSYVYFVKGKEYATASEAGKHLSLSSSTITAWCKGRMAEGRYYPPKPNCYTKKVYSE